MGVPSTQTIVDLLKMLTFVMSADYQVYWIETVWLSIITAQHENYHLVVYFNRQDP